MDFEVIRDRLGRRYAADLGEPIREPSQRPGRSERPGRFHRYSDRYSAYGRLTRWQPMLVVAAAVAVIAVAVAFVGRETTLGNAVRQHDWAAASCLGFSIAFLVAKSALLRDSAAACGIQVRLLSTARVFCEGVAVEAAAWPGKLWADGYRFAMLDSSAARAARLRAVILFRAATLSSGVILASAAVLTLAEAPIPATAASLILLLAASVWLIVRLQGHWTVAFFPRATRLIALSLSARIFDITAATLVASFVTGVPMYGFSAYFIWISLGAGMSGIPLGFGVLDLALGVALTHVFQIGVADATAAIVIYRAFGPGITLLVGAVGLTARFRRSTKPM